MKKLQDLIILDLCFVVKGEGRADPCQFPFVYKSVKYDSCMIRMNWHTGHNAPVCATKVGDGHQLIEGGICSRSCRTESKIPNSHGIL